MPKQEIETEKHLREIQLIEEFTGKSMGDVLNDFSLPELMRLSAYLDCIKFM